MDSSTPVGVTPRMLPPLTPLNRPFWTSGADGELQVLRCRTCRHWIHPPVSPCPNCGGAELASEPVSGEGTVFTYTINWHPFNPAVPVPIVIAIVELPEQAGLRFTTNLVDCAPADVRIGLPVEVRFEQHGDIWVPVFAPAAA
jgi:uncharacterized protein